MPSASDTVTKVWGTHTVKAGFFWEWIRNSQPANNNTNGQLQVCSGNSNTFGNEYADLLTGNLNQYTETNFNRINDIAYNTYEGFVQDSWKVNRRLTLELGLRLTHFHSVGGRPGLRLLDFRSYASTIRAARAIQYCGFEWHKT